MQVPKCAVVVLVECNENVCRSVHRGRARACACARVLCVCRAGAAERAYSRGKRPSRSRAARPPDLRLEREGTRHGVPRACIFLYSVNSCSQRPSEGTWTMDSTKRRWWAGATSSRVVLSARLYILYIHTRPKVAWDPPPGAYRARAGSRTILLWSDHNSVGKGLQL